jgi:hypothetical protein
MLTRSVDACGPCRPGGKIDDYAAMQTAIDATGHPMLLSVEGQPPFPEVDASSGELTVFARSSHHFLADAAGRGGRRRGPW